ncbi:hypothetical protein GC096_04245 [Paenibacillus sp. LMG 31461]|uniref:Uncharacterized protein n=1 Tax=Paenibacillus plantarum TaxID=2654975 RepID=A0ABX1X4D1_9BACL|nr:glycosyltransferase [Paenibacillus plantarum]NOU63254.1 hypothetical protein [Paenibacillus plantarum]
MNVGILSAATGNGHISVAKAIMSKLEEKGAIVFLRENFFEELMFSNKIMSNYYNFLLQSSTELCSKFSEHSYMSRPDLSEDFYRGTYDSIVSFLQERKYDVLISTSHTINHAMLRVINELKMKDAISYNIVVTDPFYPVSVGFDALGADHFFCTGKRVYNFLCKRGIDKDIITNIAYPVHPRFLREFTVEEINSIRERIGLKQNIPIVLINSGSQGAYHYIQFLKNLLQEFTGVQVLFISGKNETLYSMASRVAETAGDRVKVVGYTDQMDEFIQMADVVVTKPGANAFFECVYARKPMLIDAINGFLFQEKGVGEWLELYKAGVIVNNLQEFSTKLSEVLTNWNYEHITEGLHTDMPGGAEAIADSIWKRFVSSNESVSAQ